MGRLLHLNHLKTVKIHLLINLKCYCCFLRGFCEYKYPKYDVSPPLSSMYLAPDLKNVNPKESGDFY